jgi:hypothetical protein
MRSLFILALLAGTAHADVQGVYGLGIGADYGTTYLPPTAEAGLSTTITYREYAGVVGNWLLFIGEAPAPPMSTSKSESTEECHQGYCTITTTTTTTHPSQAEVDAWQDAMNEYTATKGAAMLRGEMGQELTIDVTMRSLGGNASGFKLQLFRPIPDTGGLVMIGQYALGWLTYHDVKSHQVMAENGVLSSKEVMGDHTWGYVGMPIRIGTSFGAQSRFGAHLQFDNNIYGWFLGDASPIRAGVEWIGPHVMMKVEGVVSGFRPDGGSINGSVTLAL